MWLASDSVGVMIFDADVRLPSGRHNPVSRVAYGALRRTCRALWMMRQWWRGLGCRRSRTGTGPSSKRLPSRAMACLKGSTGCPTH